MSRNPNDVKLTPPLAAPINPSLQQKSGASCFMQSTKAFFLSCAIIPQLVLCICIIRMKKYLVYTSHYNWSFFKIEMAE